MTDHYILENMKIVPVDLMTWALWFEDSDNDRQIGNSFIHGSRVSTVFLGLDYDFSRKGPTILFETIVFGGEFDQEMWRYSTLLQAKMNHQRIMNLVRLHRTHCWSLGIMGRVWWWLSRESKWGYMVDDLPLREYDTVCIRLWKLTLHWKRCIPGVQTKMPIGKEVHNDRSIYVQPDSTKTALEPGETATFA